MYVWIKVKLKTKSKEFNEISLFSDIYRTWQQSQSYLFSKQGEPLKHTFNLSDWILALKRIFPFMNNSLIDIK